MTPHTCVNTAPAGGHAAPCPACNEHVSLRIEAEKTVVAAAKAYFRRRSHTEGSLQLELDSAVGKLIALGDF